MGDSDGMCLPGALSDCDLFAEACGVVPVLGWPAESSGGLLDQLLASWLPTPDAQSCDSNIVPEEECCVREPVAAAAGASAGNMQDDPMDDPTTADPTVLPGSMPKRLSADEHRRAQNRKHAASCRARQRATLETAQQEVRDSVAKIEFWKACITELPSGPSILANFDQAAHDQAHTSSSDEACAVQSPAPTEHSSKRSGKRKRLSTDDHRRTQNRKHAADCRARQRASLETAQQEVRENAAKIDFFLAYCSTLPCGHTILAEFDHFATSLRS